MVHFDVFIWGQHRPDLFIALRMRKLKNIRLLSQASALRAGNQIVVQLSFDKSILFPLSFGRHGKHDLVVSGSPQPSSQRVARKELPLFSPLLSKWEWKDTSTAIFPRGCSLKSRPLALLFPSLTPPFHPVSFFLFIPVSYLSIWWQFFSARFLLHHEQTAIHYIELSKHMVSCVECNKNILDCCIL